MSQHKTINTVLIVGGGSAGWLTAGLIAAQLKNRVRIKLVESVNIQTIGVGEGTWPTMRDTLKKIGIDEGTFMQACDASFKQGSEFIGWVNAEQQGYYHPFSLPIGFEQGTDMVGAWHKVKDKVDFAHAVCPQSYWCDHSRAPKMPSDIAFEGKGNYGYHLNAEKFANLLKAHCTSKLGVEHMIGDIKEVNADDDGYIHSLTTGDGRYIQADLVIDCTGSKALLINGHYNVKWLSKKDILKNDSAVATQVIHQMPSSELASCTKSTAQPYGWIWDIALPSRRGIGYTFSSEYIGWEEAKQQLERYIKAQGLNDVDCANFKEIKFNPGYREKFWHKNCVAIGMSAGFIEPLEASALVMIELSAQFLCDYMPVNREMMSIVQTRFNRKFTYRWRRIIDFLKLHYVLSQRNDTDYWRTMRIQSIPESLQDLLLMWRYQTPKFSDFEQVDEVFSAASYQYVLYGMGYDTKFIEASLNMGQNDMFKSVTQFAQHGLSMLPTNRTLIENIKEFGIAKL